LSAVELSALSIRIGVATFCRRRLRHSSMPSRSGSITSSTITSWCSTTPVLAARLLLPFESWRRFDAGRQAHSNRVLTALAASPALSENSREVVERTLA
jgi:aminopeptidase N